MFQGEVQVSQAQARLALSRGQMVFLDLVRAAAASVVLLHHVLLLSGRSQDTLGDLGSLGVSVFFLLSGFLIDQSAQRHALRSDYGLREFLIDRTARVYVCYVPALIFTAALVAPLCQRPDFVGEPHHGGLQFLGNLLMLQDYPLFQLLRRAGIDAGWFTHSYALAEPYWTVPIELYLYIGFGVAYFAYRGRGSTHWLVKLAAAVAILPVLYHAATGYGQCLTLIWLLGVAGSRWFSARPAPSLRIAASLMAVATVLMALRCASRGGDLYDLQKASFLGMFLLGGLWAAADSEWLSWPAVQSTAAFFAKTSYPLYLTHNVMVGWTVMHFGKDLGAWGFVALAAGCHACAFVFWWAFDRHYKSLARRLRATRAYASDAELRTPIADPPRTG
jgi:peptidoglycan/LPS O-acetylase OafA/YrhL